jgi:hypothetical protein
MNLQSLTRRSDGWALEPERASVSSAFAERMSASAQVFGRASRANQCPVSAVKQPCRRNLQTAEFDPDADIDRLELPQCSSPLAALCVLSFE